MLYNIKLFLERGIKISTVLICCLLIRHWIVLFFYVIMYIGNCLNIYIKQALYMFTLNAVVLSIFLFI